MRTRLTWSLTPHPPAGGFAPKQHAPHWNPSRAQCARPDLQLDRTMITDILPAYVDRFACGWHRLATTNPDARNQYSPPGRGWQAIRRDSRRLDRLRGGNGMAGPGTLGRDERRERSDEWHRLGWNEAGTCRAEAEGAKRGHVPGDVCGVAVRPAKGAWQGRAVGTRSHGGQ